jgi:hypothetical protein
VVRVGQELSGFHNARPLKPGAKGASRNDKRGLHVAFLKSVVVGMELRIREERQNPASQAGEQKLYELRRIRQAQQDAVSRGDTAVLQHFGKACRRVVDLAVCHDVRRVVGGPVTPTRF